MPGLGGYCTANFSLKIPVDPEKLPVTARELSVPTLVICDWDAFTDNVPEFNVSPVPDARKDKPSTYALVVTCPAAVGVAEVIFPVASTDMQSMFLKFTSLADNVFIPLNS